jgi:hypothetical protein
LLQLTQLSQVGRETVGECERSGMVLTEDAASLVQQVPGESTRPLELAERPQVV